MKIRNSLAYQLLKITFSFYIIVTLSVTATHMYTEWLQFDKYLKRDLIELGKSSEKGVILAMWDLDYQQVDSIAEGLYALPIVTGIKIENKKFQTIYGKKGDIVNEYELIHREEGFNFNVGKMIIFSSKQIVYERIKNVYILTIINAIVKTLALWLIVLWAGKKLLTRPLTILTEHSRLINLDQLTDKNGRPLQVNVNVKGRNEIKILEEAFNTMIVKLIGTRNDLQNLNQTLELKVQERTLQLSEKNMELEQALDEVNTLRGILPICAHCKKNSG